MMATSDYAPGLSYDRPDQCPDAATHAPTSKRRGGDYSRTRTFKCPTCGFCVLLAPATDPKAEQAKSAATFAAKAADRLAGESSVTPAPAVTP